MNKSSANIEENVDLSGRGYGRQAASSDQDLARCGPGTLGGELLRRYWQPVGLSAEASNFPRPVKLLDEELILYRDLSGNVGLLYPRCMHRGASLLFGRVENDGIRCCYHGWKFDSEGHIIDMACEQESPQRRNVRQPWYPVIERYGIIFAYLGPPAKQPLFPRFSIAENLGDDEEVVASGGQSNAEDLGSLTFSIGTDYNWWNAHDNIIDPFHLYFLHSNLNGVQLVDTWRILPEVVYERTADGVLSVQYRDLGDGRLHLRIGQSFLPNLGGIAAVNGELGPSSLAWTVAVDDTHHRNFLLSRVKKGTDPGAQFADTEMGSGRWGPGKPARDWTLRDRQQWQSDYECQKSQGDISLHSEEHLSAILDGGLVVVRRLFKRQADVVANGGDPVGVAFDEPYLYDVRSGNGLVDKETRRLLEGWDGRVGEPGR